MASTGSKGKTRGPKSKTRRAVAKRFKITGTGRVIRRKQGKRHLLRRKNAKRRRTLGQATLVAKCDEPNIKADLPFG
jgi:large subunit ribosomal protein L35